MESQFLDLLTTRFRDFYNRALLTTVRLSICLVPDSQLAAPSASPLDSRRDQRAPKPRHHPPCHPPIPCRRCLHVGIARTCSPTLACRPMRLDLWYRFHFHSTAPKAKSRAACRAPCPRLRPMRRRALGYRFIGGRDRPGGDGAQDQVPDRAQATLGTSVSRPSTEVSQLEPLTPK